MSRKVFITGTGIITSIGKNTNEHLDALLHKRSGIGKLELFPSIHSETIPVGEIKLTDEELCSIAGVQPNSGYHANSIDCHYCLSGGISIGQY
jgi:3-oxoacyl-(acyl-carrier-protein) synthase